MRNQTLQRPAPTPAMEVVAAFVEVYLEDKSPDERLDFATRMYDKLEMRTVAPPIGSCPSAILHAARWWRSRLLWFSR